MDNDEAKLESGLAWVGIIINAYRLNTTSYKM